MGKFVLTLIALMIILGLVFIIIALAKRVNVKDPRFMDVKRRKR